MTTPFALTGSVISASAALPVSAKGRGGEREDEMLGVPNRYPVNLLVPLSLFLSQEVKVWVG